MAIIKGNRKKNSLTKLPQLRNLNSKGKTSANKFLRMTSWTLTTAFFKKRWWRRSITMSKRGKNPTTFSHLWALNLLNKAELIWAISLSMSCSHTWTTKTNQDIRVWAHPEAFCQTRVDTKGPWSSCMIVLMLSHKIIIGSSRTPTQ